MSVRGNLNVPVEAMEVSWEIIHVSKRATQSQGEALVVRGEGLPRVRKKAGAWPECLWPRSHSPVAFMANLQTAGSQLNKNPKSYFTKSLQIPRHK